MKKLLFPTTLLFMLNSLNDVLGHPAGEIWKAANYDRLYKCNIFGEKLVPAKGDSFARDAWVRYQNVDFGEGEYSQFRAQIEWPAPRKTFMKKIDGEVFYARETGGSYDEHPYWEVSPVYHVKGKTGTELFDVAFDPETKPETVKWKSITQPLVSRQTEQYPLGVMNLDVANGEEVFVQPDSGAAIELRLGAPDGKIIGSLPFNATSCRIEKVTGRHDLFFTFPKQNARTVDWYRFEK